MDTVDIVITSVIGVVAAIAITAAIVQDHFDKVRDKRRWEEFKRKNP